MIKVIFNASRNLTGSHLAGDAVTLTFSAQEPMTPSRRVSRTVQTSLSGKRETIYNNAVWAFDIITQPVSESTLESMIEFLTSVEDGTSFTFYPWEVSGGNPSPMPLRWTGDPLTCVLDSDQWSMQLVASNSGGGSDDWYSLSFTVVEAT